MCKIVTILMTFMSGYGLLGQEQIKTIELSAPLKPPYYFKGPNGVTGLIVDFTRCLFDDSGYQAQISISPVSRILEDVRSKPGSCSIGWFQTPERSQFAKFSEPIWHENQYSVIVHSKKKNSIQSKHESFESLLRDPHFRMIFPKGVSYGPAIDRWMTHLKSKEVVTGNFRQVIAMLSLGRADYALVNPPEWEFYHKQVMQGRPTKTLDFLSFPDLKQATSRHIMCHSESSQQTIATINTLIDARAEICNTMARKNQERHF
ncbi:transporter substrate-binding domain-containing protein [Pseudobacteriovorax antillogorgiicola]|uniref:Solute-binding protein family 3/N-terminal domain-containing protein n=1 Tax=Pseudobacteriovorax antillogorgiicola TaxID=1513793 RepID=A0A1Y6BLY8_9BACT|nr:transporter substrate-binding domain-containing protein [Pseudobacteriovorax antillogorgiicola]TCS54692.1 uncharacterized protein (TIGR02285 family) [Pseudobacteriovorax antillogorgiicola]SMF16444.1 conserved hypothetical protein [Pseudobacteriovorax antillogorgiicola]